MRNSYRHNDDGTTTIYLNRKDGSKLETTISSSDFDIVNSFEGTWYANLHISGGYRVQGELLGRKGVLKRKVIFIHRLILNPDDEMEVDHIDFDQLNNTRGNIRIVTKQQNMENRRSNKNSSTGVRGVCWDKVRNKYLASVRKNNKQYNLGRFDSLEEANKVVTEARKRIFTHSTN